MGSTGRVRRLLRPLVKGVDAFVHPLTTRDLLGLVDPLSSAKQLRGIVLGVTPVGPRSVTVRLRPGRGWRGHVAGQWARLGVEIDGVRHYRSYSLTTADDDVPEVTVTGVGRVSDHIVDHARPGDVWYLDPAEGEFVLPEGPRPLLMLTAGSGITPVIAMLRTLTGRRADADVVVLHSARTREDALFADELDALAATHPGVRFVLRLTADQGRLDLATPAELDALVPDWRDRAAYACGPAGLLEDARALWAQHGNADDLRIEAFQPPSLGGEAGEGGTVTFSRSDKTVDCDGTKPILEAGEEAGVLLPSGCRMGICRTCLVPLAAGQVRNLVTGELEGEPGELVRTCVSAPAGDVTLLT